MERKGDRPSAQSWTQAKLVPLLVGGVFGNESELDRTIRVGGDPKQAGGALEFVGVLAGALSFACSVIVESGSWCYSESTVSGFSNYLRRSSERIRGAPFMRIIRLKEVIYSTGLARSTI